jgi:HSP20 family molecular chaperone IbpA
MKTMMVLMSLLFSVQVLAQTRDELLEEFMQERRKMMESMMEMFNESFEDDFFDTTDPWGDMKSFKGVGSNISIEEKYEKDGSISILIKPQNKDVNLDIQTTDEMITIKSEIRQKSDSGMSMSSFSKSIGIPNGYKAKSPEAVDGGIKISLVPSSEVKSIMQDKKKDAKPLLKQDPSQI